MKIVHVITGLGVGGAERALHRISSRLADDVDAHVIALTSKMQMAPAFRSEGIPVTSLGVDGPLAALSGIRRLVRELERHDPDLVHTWMYHANLAGGIAAKSAGDPPTVWSLRQSNVDPAVNKRTTLLVARLGGLLSGRLPDAVVSNSHEAVRTHRALGYDPDDVRVIPNGFDTGEFRPDPEAGREIRDELGIPQDAFVAGWVGRLDPQKDPATFIEAGTRMDESAHLVLCGDGITWDEPTLTPVLDQVGRRDRFHLLGYRDDVSRLLSAFDLFVSSSLGEGFPNAVGEAMATGVPCLVTDVGDTSRLVGDMGWIVPPGDPDALAGSLDEIAQMEEDRRRRQGQLARKRIETEFSLTAIAQRYKEVYEDLCAGSADS